jgi:hypothetical protein
VRFNIGEKCVRRALDTLKTQARNEVSVAARVNYDIKREQIKLKEELGELNRFMIKQESAGWTLMSKGEALAEKQRLLAQLKRIEGQPGENNQIVACPWACRTRGPSGSRVRVFGTRGWSARSTKLQTGSSCGSTVLAKNPQMRYTALPFGCMQKLLLPDLF